MKSEKLWTPYIEFISSLCFERGFEEKNESLLQRTVSQLSRREDDCRDCDSTAKNLTYSGFISISCWNSITSDKCIKKAVDKLVLSPVRVWADGFDVSELSKSLVH